MNRHIVQTASPPDNARLLRSHCSAAVFDHIRRAALATVMLAVALVPATGCSSTGNGFNPLLISPLPAVQQSSELEENGLNNKQVLIANDAHSIKCTHLVR